MFIQLCDMERRNAYFLFIFLYHGTQKNMGKIINSINNTGKGFVGKIVTVYRLVFLGHPSLAIQVK
jgi:hypothetical protein